MSGSAPTGTCAPTRPGRSQLHAATRAASHLLVLKGHHTIHGITLETPDLIDGGWGLAAETGRTTDGRPGPYAIYDASSCALTSARARLTLTSQDGAWPLLLWDWIGHGELRSAGRSAGQTLHATGLDSRASTLAMALSRLSTISRLPRCWGHRHRRACRRACRLACHPCRRRRPSRATS